MNLTKFVTINNQNRMILELTVQLYQLRNENLQLRQKRIYSCDECDFDAYIRENIVNHKNQEHEIEENESDSEEDERPNYQCDLCDYNSSWPDSVAFHYREDHKIQMNWEEAELRLKQ